MWRCKKCGGKVISRLAMETEVSVELSKDRKPIKLAKEQKERSIIDLVKSDWTGEYCSFYACEDCNEQIRALYEEDYIEALNEIAYWQKGR